jgi:hypothetical protein
MASPRASLVRRAPGWHQLWTPAPAATRMENPFTIPARGALYPGKMQIKKKTNMVANSLSNQADSASIGFENLR